MNVPFFDLKRQYRIIKPEIDNAIENTIDRCAFVAGEKVKQFEDDFARYCGVKHAVGVSSGTSAIYVALRALGVGDGDAVITVPFTFIATVEAITLCGARPIFIDIDDNSFTLSPQALTTYLKEKCRWDQGKGNLIDKKTECKIKALMPVHLYGQIADMDEINQIAGEYSIYVIEVSAQAHGAAYKGKKSGSVGDVGAFSFYPSKNLGAYGQGGIVTTNDDEIIKKMRMHIDHGSHVRYEHEFEGWNFKMDGIQAAILDAKLMHLDEWNGKRRGLARIYSENIKEKDRLKLPREKADRSHIYHLYVVRVKDRGGFMDFLKQKNIGVSIHYPIALHLQNAYKYLDYKEGEFPVSEACAKEVVSLPMFPELTDDEAMYVAKTVDSWQ